MSLRCPPEHLADLCHHARLFTDRTGDRKGRLTPRWLFVLAAARGGAPPAPTQPA